MVNVPDPDAVPAVKVARVQTDFSLCSVCQKKRAETLVAKPTAHDQLLTCVRDRSTMGMAPIQKSIGALDPAPQGSLQLVASFVTGVGQNHRIVKLGAIYSTLGDK